MAKATQKLRVIVDRVSFYTTVRQARDGVGDSMSVNDGVRTVLAALEADKRAIGMVSTVNGHNIQVDFL